jgi:hypothetical protein
MLRHPAHKERTNSFLAPIFWGAEAFWVVFEAVTCIAQRINLYPINNFLLLAKASQWHLHISGEVRPRLSVGPRFVSQQIY